jgi:hypothetical protein
MHPTEMQKAGLQKRGQKALKITENNGFLSFFLLFPVGWKKQAEKFRCQEKFRAGIRCFPLSGMSRDSATLLFCLDLAKNIFDGEDMNIINKYHWLGFVVFFAIGLVSAVPCLAQDAPPELSDKDRFEKELSLRIKQQRVKGKELKKRGLIDDAAVVDIDYDGFVYKLEFRNGSPVSFDDLKVECRFFYSEATSGASGPLDSNTNLEDPVMKYQAEEIICSVKSNGRYKTETRAFIIQSWILPGGYYFNDGTPNRQECDEEGLWVRVTYTTSNGQKLERDFCEPESLSERVTWNGKSI